MSKKLLDPPGSKVETYNGIPVVRGGYVNVSKEITYCLEGDLEKVSENIEKFKKDGWERIDFDIIYDYGEQRKVAKVHKRRKATPEEIKSYKDFHSEREKARLDRERQQYEDLKKKFES